MQKNCVFLTVTHFTRSTTRESTSPKDRVRAADTAGEALRHDVGAGLRDGASTPERERIKTLEREIGELRKANDILKPASARFAQAALDRGCT